MTTTPFIHNVTTEGFKVTWLGRTTRSGQALPPPHLRQAVDSLARLPRPQREALLTEIQKLENAGVLRRVPTKMKHATPSLFSRFFVIAKDNGKWRAIIDLRALNDLSTPVPTKYPSIQQVARELRRDEWMIKIDLTDAFHQVPLHPDSRPLTRFAVGTATYEFTCLPMGLKASPGAFMNMIKPVYRLLREAFPGTRTYLYSDDHLVVHKDKATLTKISSWLQATLRRLGWLVNDEKSLWAPTRACAFLGFALHTRKMTLTLPGPKRRAIKHDLRAMGAISASPPRMTLRELARLVGKLNAACPAVPQGRLHSGGLQALVGTITRSSATWDDRIPAWAWAPAWEEIKKETEWWISAMSTRAGATRSLVAMKPNLLMTTDASGTGEGAAVFHLPRNVSSTADAITVSKTTAPMATFQGYIADAQRNKVNSINGHEILAVGHGAQALRDHIRGKRLWLLTDNLVTLRYLRRQRGRVAELRSATKATMASLEEAGATIARSGYIPTADNKIADSLSRKGIDHDDYRISGRLFRQACKTFHRTPKADLFATAANRQATPRFCSAGPQPGAWKIDALSFHWGRSRPGEGTPTYWANPPWSLIPQVLRKTQADGAELILVTPRWPTAPWRRLLRRLQVVAPIVIPRGQQIFAPGHKGSRELAGPTRWDTEIHLIRGGLRPRRT